MLVVMAIAAVVAVLDLNNFMVKSGIRYRVWLPLLMLLLLLLLL